MFWKKGVLVVVLACVTFMLSGCVAKSVQVVNEGEFNLMGRRITSLLQNRGVLDGEGGYMAPLVSLRTFPGPVGDNLFSGLSPAFRFKLDPTLVPPSFAATRGSSDVVEFLADGFRMMQGTTKIEVTLLGGADWLGDGGLEWFVLCRVDSPLTNEQRDYYLVVTDPLARPMPTELIAVYDCRSNQCFLYVEETPGKAPAFSPEVRVIEVERGQRAVVPAPGADKAPEPEPKSIQETSLGG